jgi:hypothetical protein
MPTHIIAQRQPPPVAIVQRLECPEAVSSQAVDGIDDYLLLA